MPLKRHLIAHRPEPDRSGLTACGQTFFVGRGSHPTLGEYEAMARIGGLVAVDHEQFEPDRNACKKCVTAWGDGARTEG